jgi:3-hydroxyisobutyrate dehydrogenase-like beta-hydroxyacid dehydrogenase
MRNQLKDLRSAHDLSSQLKLHLPMLEQALELYHGGVTAGFAHFDHSALLLELERLNPGLGGIEPQGEIPGNT